MFHKCNAAVCLTGHCFFFVFCFFLELEQIHYAILDRYV